jgi:hypothetical protein
VLGLVLEGGGLQARPVGIRDMLPLGLMHQG